MVVSAVFGGLTDYPRGEPLGPGANLLRGLSFPASPPVGSLHTVYFTEAVQEILHVVPGPRLIPDVGCLVTPFAKHCSLGLTQEPC
jgi:hypothetical protein